MLSKHLGTLLLFSCFYAVICVVPIHAQSSDFRAIIQTQSNKLSEQSREIEALEKALKESRRETSQARGEVKKLRAEWDKAIEAKTLLPQKDVDSLFSEIFEQRKQIALLNAQNKEFKERNLHLENILKEKQRTSIEAKTSSYSFFGSKLIYLLLLVPLACVIVLLVVRYQEAIVRLGNNVVHKVRLLVARQKTRCKARSEVKITTSGQKEPAKQAIFADSISRSGVFVRVSTLPSDGKKYILRVLPTDKNKAILELNSHSLYYSQWLQNAERFLSRGVVVLENVPSVSERHTITVNSGVAIFVNDDWHVEQPIQLTFA